MRGYALACLLPACLFSFGLHVPPASAVTPLPDGDYRCEMPLGNMMMLFGIIRISGNTYQGPSNDPSADPSYPYELAADNLVRWGGPLGGMSSGGNSVVATTVDDLGEGRSALTFVMQTESGRNQTIGCASDPP